MNGNGIVYDVSVSKKRSHGQGWLKCFALDSYSDWEKVAVAVLFVLVVPRAWRTNDWRESKNPQRDRQGQE